MPFTFEKTALEGVMIITPRIFPDGRGYFYESYKTGDFKQAGINSVFVQDNISSSAYGVVRGLHYQKSPHAQGKLLEVLSGSIIDVVVDIRKGSTNYGKWLKFNLSKENHKMIYVPAGFAHGFVAISETVEIHYKVDNEYCKAAEGGVLWSDPALGIDWGIENPVLSEKDAKLPPLAEADNNYVYGEI